MRASDIDSLRILADVRNKFFYVYRRFKFHPPKYRFDDMTHYFMAVYRISHYRATILADIIDLMNDDISDKKRNELEIITFSKLFISRKHDEKK